ncbi:MULTISPECIES: ABC-2 transporter permease [Paenibacillus]|uniref:ABC-2 transporter permease n=1 Tax=Paenibacillus TaxID=44249 RepID=UPI001C128D5B|nr:MULTISPECIES: ABC-2 transporter permease [Paenibacillus]MBU5344707.1 ABC-2 transporter permease [Paenibacillus lautus]MCT1402648.1 ABC-2 transporter permease [Paenibacillus sp. p3-SID867]
MLNLLRKDFIALKSSLWTILLYLAVFSIAFIPKSEMSIYFVGIYTAFGSIILATMIDIKNHNHKFLVTLPISRKHIVLAKYITAIVYTLFGVIASYGIHRIIDLSFPQLDKPDYTVMSLLVSVGMLLVLISIYMPLFYALSKKGAGIINAVFMISLIILAQPAAVLMNMVSEKGLINDQTLLLILIGIVVVFIASYFLTISLFKRKDL